MGRKAQGLSGSVLCNHNHLILRAQPSCCSWDIPSPPSSGGRVTLGQATRQCPPLTSFRPFQRKPLLILSIALSAQGGRSMAIIRYISMEGEEPNGPHLKRLQRLQRSCCCCLFLLVANHFLSLALCVCYLHSVYSIEIMIHM